MKVLFVYPNVQNSFTPQLGIASLSATLKQHGHHCDLFDLTNCPVGCETDLFEKKIHSFGPDLIAFSVRSNETRMVRRLLTHVPEGIPTVAGGYHVSLAPEDLIDCFDLSIMGEGEEALLELVEKLEKKEDISTLRNLCFERDGKIIKNELRPLIKDLDTLPYPDWGLFDVEHHTDHYLKGGVAQGRSIIGTFEGSRGCVFTCTYCSSPAAMNMYGGASWRREKSPRHLAEEIKAFREQFGLDYIYLVDEILLTKTSRIREFSSIFKEEIKTPFTFMERPELINEEKIALIAEAGAHNVAIGIESGDEELRRQELDRKVTNETTINAFALARKYGVRTHAFAMVGFPNETRESIKKSFELLNTIQPDSFQVSIFYPLRGTVLHDRSVAENWLEDEEMPDDYYAESVLNLPNRSKKEIARSQKLLNRFAGRGDLKSRVLFSLFLNAPMPFFFFAAFLLKLPGNLKRVGHNLLSTVPRSVRRWNAKASAQPQTEQVVMVSRGTDPIYEKPIELTTSQNK